MEVPQAKNDIKQDIESRRLAVQKAFQLSSVLLLVCLVVAPTQGGPDDKPCSRVAKAAKDACGDQIEADFSIAIGKCNNLPISERDACRQQAQADKQDAREQCAEQFNARRDVCNTLGQTEYHPIINPAEFVDGITNPFFPLTPGTTLIYSGGGEVDTFTVTDKTQTILGVRCIVVHDVVAVNGEVIEDTLDRFAQDIKGNVWYFGEVSQEFENGELVSLEGSWRAGVNGAQPGIIMKADPRAGDVYRQEFLLNEAEDLAEVMALNGSAMVPAASCNNDCLVTREFTPLEPGTTANKYYARGIGVILEVDPSTGVRTELVQIIRP